MGLGLGRVDGCVEVGCGVQGMADGEMEIEREGPKAGTDVVRAVTGYWKCFRVTGW